MKILISFAAFALATAPCLAARAQGPAVPGPGPVAPTPAPAAQAPGPAAPTPAPAAQAPPPAAPVPLPAAPVPAPIPPVTTGAVALPPPPGMPWGPPAQSAPPVPPGYAPPEAYVPPAPISDEQPGDEFARLRRGFHPGVSVGFTSMNGAVVAGGTAGFIANFGVGRHVDLRAGLRIAIGPGNSVGGFGTNPYGVDGTLEVPLDARFNFGSVYTIIVGFSQGALFLNASDCNLVDPSTGNSISCGRSITPYYLFGPELSFTSFRMGSKREVELDILGGPQFIAPQGGVVFYPRVSVAVSYMLL